MKKKLGYRLAGRKRKPDGMRVDSSGEGADSTSSPPQPEPHIAAGKGYDREGDESNVAGERVFSMGGPQPDGSGSAPTRGSDNSQEGGVVQRHANLHPGTGTVVEGGREPGRVYPSPPTPSISYGGKSDSTWAWQFWLLSLIVPSGM